MPSISKFDKPATVSWSSMGPHGKPMLPNVRNFNSLREAILYARWLPAGSRSKATVRSAKKKYDAAEVEELEKEMRQR